MTERGTLLITAGAMRAATVYLILTLLTPMRADRLASAGPDNCLVTCVFSVVQRHFVSDQQVLVLTTSEDDEHFDLVLRKLNEMSLWSLRVSRPGSKPRATPQEYYDKIASYVIFTRGSDEVEGLTDELMGSAGWNSQARFLVVVTLQETTPERQALSVVREMWDNARTLNVVVLVRLDSVFRLYTWFPYQSHLHCDDVSDVVLISHCSPESNAMLAGHRDLFPNKVPKNFHGCPITASLPHDYAPERYHISNFLVHFNFTVDLRVKDERDGSVYDRVKSSVDDLTFGSSEIAFGGIPLLKGIANFADHSFPYYEILYTWYVPCARPLSRLEAIRKVFTVTVWVSLSATMFLVTVVLWRLGRRPPVSPDFSSIEISLYNVWAVALSVSVTNMPRTSRLRVVILTWICYCFAFSTVFQTFFTSYLVDPGLEKQITSLDELLESKMEFGFRPELDVYFADSSNWIHRYLRGHRKQCVDTEECMQRVRDSASFATITESWTAGRYLNPAGGGPAVCRMNDFDTFPIRIVSYFRKGSILKDEFNKIIVSMVESGQIVKADDERLRRSVLRYVGRGDGSDEYFVFTTAHLLPAFYALLLGQALSLVVFLGEIAYDKV